MHIETCMFRCASVNIEVKVDKPLNCNANSLMCVQVQCQPSGNLAAAKEAACCCGAGGGYSPLTLAVAIVNGIACVCVHV